MQPMTVGARCARQTHQPASIRLSGSAPKKLEDGVEVSIRDNGTGIPDDVIDKIFNPFFTTKPTDQGTGLGLAMSNDIIREHGGTITVDSEPDSYTEFTVHLPFDTTPTTSDSSPAPLD